MVGGISLSNPYETLELHSQVAPSQPEAWQMLRSLTSSLHLFQLRIKLTKLHSFFFSWIENQVRSCYEDMQVAVLFWRSLNAKQRHVVVK